MKENRKSILFGKTFSFPKDTTSIEVWQTKEQLHNRFCISWINVFHFDGIVLLKEEKKHQKSVSPMTDRKSTILSVECGELGMLEIKFLFQLENTN